MTSSAAGSETALVAAIRAGDEAAFTAIAERYRHGLLVHCYRMLGSYSDAEDLVQETLLRAWRARASFEGRSSLRTWLSRIATNACLNALKRGPRRVLPPDVVGPTAPEDVEVHGAPRWKPEVPWLEPCPDTVLERAEAEPEAIAVSRETIELAYLTAVQHLPPRQRAILILRDVLAWSEQETAALLETTVPAIKSAHQRAKATMRDHLPSGRLEWSGSMPSAAERRVLDQFMDAYDRADARALTALLRADARQTMPPLELWFVDRAAIVAHHIRLLGAGGLGSFRMVATAANRQLAAASYLRRHDDDRYRLTGVNVLRIEDGRIAEITSFSPRLCHGFDLPSKL
jgi:RNA polymerase sigma-70 factor (ECF subfamily)